MGLVDRDMADIRLPVLVSGQEVSEGRPASCLQEDPWVVVLHQEASRQDQGAEVVASQVVAVLAPGWTVVAFAVQADWLQRDYGGILA
jgi:hypothetical protein